LYISIGLLEGDCTTTNLQSTKAFEEQQKQDSRISESSRDYLNLKHGPIELEDNQGLENPSIFPRPKSEGNHSRITFSTKFNFSSDDVLGVLQANSYHSRLLNKAPRSRYTDPVLVLRDWRRYIEKNLISFPPITNISKSVDIPNVIWTYWAEGEERLPYLLASCIMSWRRHNPLHSVIVLSRSTIESVLDFSVPSNFDLISSNHQKDWVRLAILMQEGGTWVEPAFIMTEPIVFVQQMLADAETPREGIIFFMDYYTFYPKFPFFEGYFISVGKHLIINTLIGSSRVRTHHSLVS
jgi:hypothetical protein